MNVYLITDTHFNYNKIATYCERPDDFTERIINNWRRTVRPEDLIIHLGDVFIDKADGWEVVRAQLTGRKVLVRGNHDRKRSLTWWMEHGFDFACDSMWFRNMWLTHEPDPRPLPEGCLNLHGHIHTWERCHTPPPHRTWQRMLSIEYCNYLPVNFDKFVAQPEKYRAKMK